MNLLLEERRPAASTVQVALLTLDGNLDAAKHIHEPGVGALSNVLAFSLEGIYVIDLFKTPRRRLRYAESRVDVEPTPGFEPGTFSLPRKCSTT
jgi:hypothetical protein